MGNFDYHHLGKYIILFTIVLLYIMYPTMHGVEIIWNRKEPGLHSAISLTYTRFLQLRACQPFVLFAPYNLKKDNLSEIKSTPFYFDHLTYTDLIFYIYALFIYCILA